MQNNGYAHVPLYVQPVLNWRRASDECGLSAMEHPRFNHELLDYIIDELMPWHRECDFSTLEVNR